MRISHVMNFPLQALPVTRSMAKSGHNESMQRDHASSDRLVTWSTLHMARLYAGNVVLDLRMVGELVRLPAESSLFGKIATKQTLCLASRTDKVVHRYGASSEPNDEQQSHGP